jgi:phosphate transport system substrate-binding protein
VSRPLFIYAKKAHVGQVPGMAEFLAEYVSAKAMGEDGYLADKGLITLPADQAAASQAAVKDMTVLTADGLK